MVNGVDNYTGPSAANNEVPVGAVVKYIEIQHPTMNLVSVAAFMNIAIQHLRSGQTIIDPRAVGGNPQRNQVHFQTTFSLGKEQNQTRVYRFKIPKKFQRVREGDKWEFTYICSQIFTDQVQIIYKFYR